MWAAWAGITEKKSREKTGTEDRGGRSARARPGMAYPCLCACRFVRGSGASSSSPDAQNQIQASQFGYNNTVLNLPKRRTTAAVEPPKPPAMAAALLHELHIRQEHLALADRNEPLGTLSAQRRRRTFAHRRQCPRKRSPQTRRH